MAMFKNAKQPNQERKESPFAECIYKKDAIEAFTLDSDGKRFPEYDTDGFPVQISIRDVKNILRRIPSVASVELSNNRIGAYWIKEPGKIPKCSSCGNYSDDADKEDGGNYCSFCGAVMRSL